MKQLIKNWLLGDQPNLELEIRRVLREEVLTNTEFIEYLTSRISSKINREEVKFYADKAISEINSEGFIDKVVERINRKQVK